MNKIIQGDALEVLKTLPSESVDCVMTSPPYYGLRDYGTAQWEGGSIDCSHRIDRGSRRVTDATIIDQFKQGSVSGEYVPNGSSCPKCGAARKDKQLGLEKTYNDYINNLCSVFDEVKRVLKKEGTCWVNIGDSYSSQKHGNAEIYIHKKKAVQNTFKKPKQDIQEKSLLMIPSRFSIEMVNRGWILRNEIIWHKPSCMPQSVKDRFTVDFEKIFFFVKSKKYYFQQQLEASKSKVIEPRMMKEIRQVYSAKYKNIGIKRTMTRNMRTTWAICPKPFKEAHFAVFPPELCVTPIKAGCPDGGIVLDPFFGSGTTGFVAQKLNRNYLGIELNPEYIKIAEKRLAQGFLSL